MVERVKTKGPTQRRQRVGELVRHALAEIITRGDIHDPELSRLFPSFHEVRMSPDLKLATVYVSSLGRNEDDALLVMLKAKQKVLRYLVAEKINLRYAPELRFRVDETLDEAMKIDALLHSDKVRQDLEKREDDETDEEQPEE